MTKGLVRYQQTGDLHFVTFNCYQRRPYLSTAHSRELFETVLEQIRQGYGFFITGYVVMPEHVHLLVSEPERGFQYRKSTRLWSVPVWKQQEQYALADRYLRFLGSLLEAGSTIPEEVLDALQPEVASLLLTHFAPPESLNYYSPERFRIGRCGPTSI